MTSLKLKIPVSEVHERLIHEVYEGDKVVSRGSVRGHSFTTLGKNRIAQMVAGTAAPGTVKLDTYRILVDVSTWFSSAATVVSFDFNGGMVTAATQEFQSAGEYKRLQGWSISDTPDVASYYHYVTTSVTIGAGQTVKFFVEYTFDGLGAEGAGGNSVNGDNICASLLFNTSMGSGSAPYRIGSIEFVDSVASDSAFPIVNNISVTNNIVTISGTQFTLANVRSTHYIRARNSCATPLVFHEWSYVAADGEASGPFTINNDTGSVITLQTDMEFTFSG